MYKLIIDCWLDGVVLETMQVLVDDTLEENKILETVKLKFVSVLENKGISDSLKKRMQITYSTLPITQVEI